jgi:hypothetical protein
VKPDGRIYSTDDLDEGDDAFDGDNFATRAEPAADDDTSTTRAEPADDDAEE